MKNLVSGFLLVGMIVLGVITWLVPSQEVSYEAQNATTSVETTQEVKYPEAWTIEAQEAFEAVIRQKELETEKVELEAILASTTDRINAIDKEIGVYWKSKSNIVKLIKDTFPEDPHTALAIAKCESGLNINAYNPNNPNGSTDSGLWQINSVHDKRLGELGLDKYDPEEATVFARMLYDERGGSFTDWVCYTHNLIAMR